MERAKIKNLFLYVGFFIIAASLVMLQILYTRALTVAVGFGFEFIIISLAILGMGLGGILVFFLLNNFKSSSYVYKSLIISSLAYIFSAPLPFLVIKAENSSFIFLFFITGFFTYFFGGIIASIVFRYYAKKISIIYFLSLFGSAFGALGVIVLLEFFGMPIHIVCPNMNADPVVTKSNAFSQVDIYLGENELYDYTIMVDCNLTAPVINYNTADEERLDRDARIYFPFPTDNFSSALMIGTAGGKGVVQAVRAGISNITAVEINPLVVEGTEILKRSDNIYYHDSVEVFVQEGRAFVSNSKDKYDLIYLIALQFGRVGYGTHTLSENYLYTKEAFESYFNHLNENGILAIGVRESFLPRFTETAVISLLEKGVDPTKRVILFEGISVKQGKRRAVAIVRGSNFSKAEGDSVIKRANELGLGAKFLDKSDIEYYKTAPAMTDDRPYFYFWNRGNAYDEHAFKYILSFFLIVLFTYLLTALAPLYKLKSLGSGKLLYLLGFFSAIGIGFITLELTFIHKFTLFLGHPILSFAVTLASVLFFGGLGSLFTGRFKERDITSKIAKIIFLLVLIVILFILFIDFALSKLIFLDSVYKIIFAISALALPGFLMGMIFPLGLKIARRTSKKIIPWMVGIDGITSVLGGILSFVISLMLGFNAALILGIIVYTFALLMVLRIKYEI